MINFYKYGKNNVKPVNHNSVFLGQKWLTDATNAIFETNGKKAYGSNSFGFQNAATGLGGIADATSYDVNVAPGFLDYTYFDALYRTNLFARKVIDIPATDMTVKWREFNGKDPKNVEKRTLSEKKFKIATQIRTAVKYANLYGGSALMIILDDGARYDEPLDISKIRPGQLKKFQPVFLGQMYPSELTNLDPSSMYFRRPIYYNIANNKDLRVHQSRLVLFDGVELPLYSSLSQLSFGDSKLTAIVDVLNAAKSVYLNIANLIVRANQDVIGMKDFTIMAAGNSNDLLQRMDISQRILGNLKTLVIDSEDKYERRELTNLQGLVDILLSYLQMCASGADMPLTRFLGTSVGGFSSGDNEIIEYYDSINAKQVELEAQLRIVDRVMEQNLFGRPLDLTYNWITLHKPAPSQKTDIEQKNAQRDQIYLDAGVITPQIIARQLRKDAIYDLDDEYIDNLSNEPIQLDLSEFDTDLSGDSSEENPVAASKE